MKTFDIWGMERSGVTAVSAWVSKLSVDKDKDEKAICFNENDFDHRIKNAKLDLYESWIIGYINNDLRDIHWDHRLSAVFKSPLGLEVHDSKMLVVLRDPFNTLASILHAHKCDPYRLREDDDQVTAGRDNATLDNIPKFIDPRSHDLIYLRFRKLWIDHATSFLECGTDTYWNKAAGFDFRTQCKIQYKIGVYYNAWHASATYRNYLCALLNVASDDPSVTRRRSDNARRCVVQSDLNVTGGAYEDAQTWRSEAKYLASAYRYLTAADHPLMVRVANDYGIKKMLDTVIAQTGGTKFDDYARQIKALRAPVQLELLP